MRPTAQLWIGFGISSLLSLQAVLRVAKKPAEPVSKQQLTVPPATSESRVDSALDEAA